MIMKLLGNGLNEHSHMYFYTPSAKAKRLLYYPLCAGEFYCNGEYSVEREQYNSFLLLLVVDGEIEYNEYTALQNELLLIDCYKPHKYYTNTNAHTLWIHFDGNNSRDLFEELLSQKGEKVKCSADMAEQLRELIQSVKNSESEYIVSARIYRLLLFLLMPESSNNTTVSMIESAKKYIMQNFDCNITVEKIAKALNMSTSYFSKKFKQATTFSPYDYLLNIRLEKAKEYLLKTDMPISEIAYKTGFNSDANFIYFFKKQTGVSPLKFRKIQF